MRITVEPTFAATLSRALARLTTVITSKLDDFFELSEYDWTPQTREDAPSMYLYELVNWLTTIVDSLLIKEAYKDEAYRGAVTYIAECLLVRSIVGLMSRLTDEGAWYAGVPDGAKRSRDQRERDLQCARRR